MTTEYTTRQLEMIRNKAQDILEGIGEEFAATYTGDNSFTAIEDTAVYNIIRGELYSVSDGISLGCVEDQLNDAEMEVMDNLHDSMIGSLKEAGYTGQQIDSLLNN